MEVRPGVDFGSYCVISIWFGCNSRCTICMLSEIEQTLSGLPFEQFKEVTTRLAGERRYRNLILSGGEVTTFGDLDRYVRFAASLDWFEKIQIQTNGRRLADKPFAERLVACGVNEFFVSVQGLEEEHDATSRVPGSFRQTMKGIENLAGQGVGIITNTVLTARNLHTVEGVIDLLAALPVMELQLWNFFPMGRVDRGNQVPSLREFAGAIPGLADTAEKAGKPLVLKGFPECLPAPPTLAFNNLFPATVLPDLFWKRFGESGFGRCVHRGAGRCASRNCWGLSSAYVEKYGDERDLLRPIT